MLVAIMRPWQSALQSHLRTIGSKRVYIWLSLCKWTATHILLWSSNVALWEYEQHRNTKCLFGLFIFYVTSVAGLLWVWNDKLRPQLLRFILLTLQGIQHKTSWNDNKNKQYIYYLYPYCYLGNRISLLQATRMVYSFQCRWSFLKFTLKQIS